MHNMKLSMLQPREADDAVMTELELDELFDLFTNAGLPSTAMNPEMADGYLTACVIGPELPPVHEWMERIFGQPNLPICADQVQQDRLLTLLCRRGRDIQRATALAGKDRNMDTMFLPALSDVAPENCIQPLQLDAHGKRLGVWRAKEWVKGFCLDIRQDPSWAPFLDDPDQLDALAPFMLYDYGYNAKQPNKQIDDDTELLGFLCLSVYAIRQFWRDYRRSNAVALSRTSKTSTEPFLRLVPKTGRNDPCTCDSGKKFKKCCGA